MKRLTRNRIRQIIKEEINRLVIKKAKADPKAWGAGSSKVENLAGKGKSGAYGSGWDKSSALEKEIKKLLGHG